MQSFEVKDIEAAQLLAENLRESFAAFSPQIFITNVNGEKIKEKRDRLAAIDAIVPAVKPEKP